MSKKLNKVFEKTERMFIDDNTKIVIMSDSHRGAGDNRDNFLKNREIFQTSLFYYYKRGFTYIELGDGDDMWEVENYKDIIETHLEVFQQLKKFHDSNRLIMIYGNHDIVKKYPQVLKENFDEYQGEPLLKNLSVKEALILNYQNHDLFLVHGHQVDFLNSSLWRLSRFLVRNVWHSLEEIGINDLTSSAKNYGVTKKTEKKLQKWSDKNQKILIAGHTHRPSFPEVGESLYFNDGSAIHPDGITCLEIENGQITLVKWELHVNEEEKIPIKRKVLAGKESIIKFFK